MVAEFSQLSRRSRTLFGLSPWLIVGVSAILGLAILITALRDTEREKRRMEENLVDRANALIWALEAGARTWLGYEGERNVVQPLVDETAKQPGIMYIAVVGFDGKILAHSDPAMPGRAMERKSLPKLDGDEVYGWRERMESEVPVFEVYRLFAPIRDTADDGHGGGGGHHGKSRMRQMRQQGGMGGMGGFSVTTPSIVMVGLDLRPFQEAFRADSRNTFLSAAVVAALDCGSKVLERETELAFPGGGTVPVNLSASQIRNAEGALLGHIFILGDIAEVKRLQSEVQRNERLTALGNLAAGVAHEIRNPLSTIKGLATYMVRKLPAGGREEAAARTMIQEVNRLNTVVSELLEFARPNVVKGGAADVNEVVARALRLADADLKGKDIRVEFRPCADAPGVRLNAERVYPGVAQFDFECRAGDVGGRDAAYRDGICAGDGRCQRDGGG